MPNQFSTPRPIIGDTFGRWTVIAQTETKGRKAQVVCRCLCGTVRDLNVTDLRRAHTRSCGCLRAETTGDRHRTHGESKTVLYRLWMAIKRRCNNTRTRDYPFYGGRGIAVCPEWEASFIAFRDWALGHGYGSGLEIDRIDTDGNYEPANCRFVPRQTNIDNRRMTWFVTAFGETRRLNEWVQDERCVVAYLTLAARLRAGWESERAITTPPVVGRWH